MHLGLRPRLKARPSLLDLITRKDINQLSAQVPAIEQDSTDPDGLPDKVPLPDSPDLQLKRAPTAAEIPSVVIEYFDLQEDKKGGEQVIMASVCRVDCGHPGTLADMDYRSRITMMMSSQVRLTVSISIQNFNC
jgi:hypothetical protein